MHSLPITFHHQCYCSAYIMLLYMVYNGVWALQDLCSTDHCWSGTSWQKSLKSKDDLMEKTLAAKGISKLEYIFLLQLLPMCLQENGSWPEKSNPYKGNDCHKKTTMPLRRTVCCIINTYS